MTKTIKTFPLARTCRICKKEIVTVLMQDTDGYYVCEKCGCDAIGQAPRKNSYDIPDYLSEIKKRIDAERTLVDELAKYLH